jgi:hypothetical protein
VDFFSKLSEVNLALRGYSALKSEIILTIPKIYPGPVRL